MTYRHDTADVTLRAGGTRVSKEIRATRAFFDLRRRAVLLVHGYNVNEDEAVSALGGFRSALAHFAPELQPDTFICTWAGN